ncbi:MAG: nuclease-related domain-containing protein [Solirubrobacteraceae bacterium]
MTASYARRQQWRRLMTAASRAAGAVGALVAAALATAAEEVELGLLLALLSGVLALASRHSLSLAARSRVGADSEAQVRRALNPRVREGWRVEHAVDWPGRGDLDHVLRSPSGVGFVIETKTLRYSRAHVRRTIEAARRLARERRRYPRGVLPVMCGPALGESSRCRRVRSSSRSIAWSRRSAGPPNSQRAARRFARSPCRLGAAPGHVP